MVNNSDIRQFELQSEQAQNAYEMQKLQYAPSGDKLQLDLHSQNNNFKFRDYRWDPYSMLASPAIPIFNGDSVIMA